MVDFGFMCGDDTYGSVVFSFKAQSLFSLGDAERSPLRPMCQSRHASVPPAENPNSLLGRSSVGALSVRGHCRT